VGNAHLTPDAGFQSLTVLLQLEAMARRAEDGKALQFLIVNETRRLLSYRQAILLAGGDRGVGSMRVEAVSSIAVVDRQAPMMQWLERALPRVLGADAARTACRLHFDDAPDEIAQGLREYSLPQVAWMPLPVPAGALLGGVWLSRETPWSDAELALMDRLGETYAHAWQALAARRPARMTEPRRTALRYGIAAALLALMLWPVRMSALAPVEVVAKAPEVVSAPLDGVIGNVEVEPNQAVEAGQILLRFEDTVLRNDYEVAEKTLAVAVAEHLRAMQGAFQDDKTKADVALLKAKVELAVAERDYAKDVLSRVEVKAPRAGLVLFHDKADWIGKPVKTGERILEIADPDQVRLRVDVPVKDALVLHEGAEVLAFLDADPLHPLSARISHAAYRAEVGPDEALAYRVDADLEQAPAGENRARIGWQGTAKIHGERAPLFFYLLRRPIAAARQYLGF
jgi:hypothetical protein